MKNLFKLFTFCIIVLGLVSFQSCKTQDSMKTKDLSSNLKGMWILKSINGEDVTKSEGKVASISFDFEENIVSGNGGCNQYSGNFTLKDNIFTPSPFRSTRMACPELDKEYKFLEVLSKESTLNINNYNLQFIQDGNVVLEFTPRMR